jgi:Holliday junction resolvase-like predicted endonuclease
LEYNEFVGKIAFEKELNPFHSEFSYSKIKDFVDSIDIEKSAVEQISLIFYILITSNPYKEFYENLGKLFDSNKQISNYYLYSISVANHDAIVLHKNIEDVMKKAKEMKIIDFYKYRTDVHGKSLTITSMLDVLIDLLDFNFGLLRFASGTIFEANNGISSNDQFNEYYKYLFESNIFQVLKSTYESVCFEKGTCTIEGRMIKVRNLEDEYSLNKAISLLRIESNTLLNAQRVLSNRSFIHMLKANRTYKDKDIKSISINKDNGEIEIDLVQAGFNENLESRLVLHGSCAINYLGYLSDAGNQELKRFQKLFALLQYIAEKIRDTATQYEYSKESNEVVDPRYYLFLINKISLIGIIKKISGEENAYIAKFLNHLTNDGTKSFWVKPLLANGDKLHIVLQSIINANSLNISDGWIQDHIKDFDSKGERFEDYVKLEIKHFSSRKKFMCEIAKQKKYSISKNNYEEIDLIWETKHNVIIAEVKNIRYPFTSRNINEYRKIIEKATMQINRKAEYLLKNKEKFPSICFEKPHYRCVLINYPLLTGYLINGVPIIDIGALRQYIDVGFSAGVVFQNGQEEHIDKKIFYSNEDEYSENLPGYILNPEVINAYKPHLKYEEIEYEIFDGYMLNMKEVISI